ncbi:MAG: hypothetical protein OSB10_09915 [Planctomycetota bacterium]|nr:hypothetical protein [Planctomycetota bacterium]
MDPLFSGQVATTCNGPFPIDIGGSMVTGIYGVLLPGEALFDWNCGATPLDGITIGDAGQACSIDPGSGIVGECGDDAVPADCILPPPDQAEDAGFHGEICIWREGVHTCEGDFPFTRYPYTTIVDSRDCTPCGCINATPGTCDVEVEVFSDVNCVEPVGNIDSSALLCESLNYTNGGIPDAFSGFALQATVLDIDPTGAECTATVGGEPTPDSDVSLTDKVTVCCDQE